MAKKKNKRRSPMVVRSDGLTIMAAGVSSLLVEKGWSRRVGRKGNSCQCPVMSLGVEVCLCRPKSQPTVVRNSAASEVHSDMYEWISLSAPGLSCSCAFPFTKLVCLPRDPHVSKPRMTTKSMSQKISTHPSTLSYKRSSTTSSSSKRNSAILRGVALSLGLLCDLCRR